MDHRRSGCPPEPLVQVVDDGSNRDRAGYAHSRHEVMEPSWGVMNSRAYRTTPEQVRGLAGAAAIAAGSYTSMA
jgi:hypothetical protein